MRDFAEVERVFAELDLMHAAAWAQECRNDLKRGQKGVKNG